MNETSRATPPARPARTCWVGLSLLVLLGPAGAAERVAPAAPVPQERFVRTFALGPEGSVVVSNVSGDIVVRGVDGDAVRLEARARGLDAAEIERRVEIVASGSHLRIEVRRERGRRAGIDFDLAVPHGTAIRVQTVSGDVDVADLRGEARVEAVSGDVRVHRAARLASAKTVSGTIELADVAAAPAMEIASVSGSIAIAGVAGRLELSTVSGDVDVRGARCEEIEIKSVSGELRYEGSLVADGRYEAKTHSGDIRLRVPADSRFELDAGTFSGEIVCDFPLEATRTTRRRLAGTVGGGGAVLELTTFSGDIRIEKAAP